MQSYSPVTSGMTLSNSLAPLTNNDLTILSQSSGTAFPTANLQAGMPCFRTDLNKLYLLKDTAPTWELVMDLSQTALPTNNPTWTGQMNMVDANSYIRRVGTTSYSIESTQYGFICGQQGGYICANAYWDGSAWQRYDTTQPSSVMYVSPAGSTITFQTVAAGTGAITWTAHNVWHDGNFTPSSYLLTTAQAADSAKLGNVAAASYAQLANTPNFTNGLQSGGVAVATVNSTVANATTWNGSHQTISTAAPSGGANGDIWLQYS